MVFTSLCCVMIRVGRSESEGARLCLGVREICVTRPYLCLFVSLAFCLIICMYDFVHSCVIYNVTVTSVYTPCIYTFYKYIYKDIWTIHWSVFVKGGNVHNSFCCFSIIWMVLSYGYLAGTSLLWCASWAGTECRSLVGGSFSAGRTGPLFLVRPEARLACFDWVVFPFFSPPSALVFCPSRKVIRVVLLSTRGRCCEDVVFTGMWDFLDSRVGTLKSWSFFFLMNYFNVNVFLFLSVAKCLQNNDCEQKKVLL